MNMIKTLAELSKVRRAVALLLTAASAESKAVERALHSPDTTSMTALHHAHLDELDALQTLLASLEMLERRLPSVRAGADSRAARH